MVTELVHSFSLMAAATIVYGCTQRLPLERWVRHVILGAVFGFGAAFSMLEPMLLAPGVIADPRNLYIAFSGAFLGPIAVVVSLSIGIATRLYIGGIGAPLGIVSMSIAAVIGLIWSVSAMKSEKISLLRCALIGASVALTLALFPLLPVEGVSFLSFGPTILIFDIVGGCVFGMLIERERRLARRERLLTESANVDALTGVLNRRGLFDAYSEAARSRVDGAVLLMIDLDRFKTINDTHGHPVGDAVLRRAARVIASVVRQGDILARIGGEEFVVLIRGVGKETALETAERIRAAISARTTLDDVPTLRITASVGGAYFESRLPEMEDALALADARLYEAKELGRDRTIVEWKTAA